MQTKLVLSIEDLKLIQHALKQYKNSLPETISIYMQDNEINTAKAFADDISRCNTLIELIDKQEE